MAFYPALGLVGIAVVLFPIGNQFASIVLFEFMFDDLQRVRLMGILNAMKMIEELVLFIALHCGSLHGTSGHVNGSRQLASQSKTIVEHAHSENFPHPHCAGVHPGSDLPVYIPLCRFGCRIGRTDFAGVGANYKPETNRCDLAASGEGLCGRERCWGRCDDSDLSSGRMCVAHLVASMPM